MCSGRIATSCIISAIRCEGDRAVFQIGPQNVIVNFASLAALRAEFGERHCVLMRLVLGPAVLMRLLPLVLEIANIVCGDTRIFRIGPDLQHRVTPVTGTVTKAAYAGWFRARPASRAIYGVRVISPS
jgi:hypothetical protein